MMASTKADAGSGKVQIVYDKECPACSYYCELYQSTASAEEGEERIELLDARETSSLMGEITAREWDIDEGMVVAVDGELHYGGDAISKLAQLDDRRGWFSRLNRLLFRSPAMARDDLSAIARRSQFAAQVSGSVSHQ